VLADETKGKEEKVTEKTRAVLLERIRAVGRTRTSELTGKERIFQRARPIEF